MVNVSISIAPKQFLTFPWPLCDSRAFCSLGFEYLFYFFFRYELEGAIAPSALPLKPPVFKVVVRFGLTAKFSTTWT